jgi:UDP:flavonoid glycosyltransferase YjiC (YdhE family)
LTKHISSCLITPLDWGLGHAARCLPLIHSLEQKGIEVHIACSKSQLKFFKKECPNYPILEIPSSTLVYPKNKKIFIPSVLFQLIAALPTEKKARQLLKNYIDKKNISLLISDSRPLMLRACKQSIYITHQLHPKPGFAGFFISALQQYAARNSMSVWIPDKENQESSLAGQLSHPAWNKKCIYIGVLSRFKKTSAYKGEHKKLLVLLSGPEPSRSILENKLVKLLQVLNIPFFLVRGTEANTNALPANISCVNLADTNELKYLFGQCRAVISRSGYSSIMDAHVLGIPWLMIPTPGQTEQEYLSAWNRRKSGIQFLNEDEIKPEKISQWWEAIMASGKVETSTENDGLHQVIEDAIRQAGLPDFPENP